MHTKLHINISQGIIDVEGDTDLVREIYTDFKDRLLNVIENSSSDPTDEAAGSDAPPQFKSKRRSTQKKKSSSGEGNSGVVSDSPKMDKNLDTSKLAAYYRQFDPKNSAEKILIFLKFMIDELKIPSPNTDQVFTCFLFTKQKIPKIFSQAFRDASGRRFGFIEYSSSTNIPITIVGENYFNHELKRNDAE